VCSSAESAQRIHKLVEEMIYITNRAREYDSRIKHKKLKSILLPQNSRCYEGKIVLFQKDFFRLFKLFSYIFILGLYEYLSQGCDILICSTPLCLIHMLDHKKTNLDRLQHMVFDEAYLLAENYFEQISKVMMCYREVLQIRPTPAQFLVFSSLWSSKHVSLTSICLICQSSLKVN